MSDDDPGELELKRLKEQLERERELESKALEREESREERRLEREAKDLQREAKKLERQAKELERTRRRGLDGLRAFMHRHEHGERDGDGEGHRAGHGEGHREGHHWHGHGDDHDWHDHGQGGEGAGGKGEHPRMRWEREQERHWERFEHAWRRRLEQRMRWEQRRAEHRKRWKQRRKRWHQMHEEREMWLRLRKTHPLGREAWGPWWLQARMRKRIFLWLAVAFASGATFMHFWPMLHWWHGLLALFALSGMSGAIAIKLTRPLTSVIRVAQDIGEGKLDTRLDINEHGGETRLLAMAINEMAERIEQQLKDQRQLLAAVSHELRTPLGHMRVLIETARATIAVGDRTPSGDCKALGELEREVMMLDDLVGRLLASSRLEFGNLDVRPIDLGELVAECATAAGVAPEAIEAIGDVHAAVDPTLVRRAVANLLDNARVHGNGVVAVRIERRARQVAIEVDDAGPGMPADRRADAFRAFVPSRAGGLGLGLALVSRIAVAHNGGAWITDRPGGGARVGFTVELGVELEPGVEPGSSEDA